MNAAPERPTVAVVVPTYRRGPVLLETLGHLRALDVPPDEILVVDQTRDPEPAVAAALEAQARAGEIAWLRRARPSIPAAMNEGLLRARSDVVLFLDDDVVPWPGLVAAHAAAHAAHDGPGALVVAGRVLQPWHDDEGGPARPGFSFAGREAASIGEFMAGNVSLRRAFAVEAGGFDERFVRAAYRFEAEAAHRFLRRGATIRFEPAACLRHLKAERGGTRTFGRHDRTWRPGHAVGACYYLLRVRPRGWVRALLARPWRAVRTRHHLRRPWWIPATLVAEGLGFAWAVGLWLAGPRLLGRGRTTP